MGDVSGSTIGLLTIIGVIGIAMSAIGIDFYNKHKKRKKLSKNNRNFLYILLGLFCALIVLPLTASIGQSIKWNGFDGLTLPMLVIIGVIGIAMAAIGIEFYNKDEDRKDLPKSNMTFLIILVSVFTLLTLIVLIAGGIRLQKTDAYKEAAEAAGVGIAAGIKGVKDAWRREPNVVASDADYQ